MATGSFSGAYGFLVVADRGSMVFAINEFFGFLVRLQYQD
jgi:hypothetical protein